MILSTLKLVKYRRNFGFRGVHMEACSQRVTNNFDTRHKLPAAHTFFCQVAYALWDVAKKLDTDGESGDGRQIFDEYLNLKVNMSQRI